MFYHVSKKWIRAIRYGWDSACTENSNILTYSKGERDRLTVEQFENLREVIVNELPSIFECFYQGVRGLLESVALDKDATAEVIEETLGVSLGEALLWLGAWIDSSLIQQESERVNKETREGI